MTCEYCGGRLSEIVSDDYLMTNSYKQEVWLKIMICENAHIVKMQYIPDFVVEKIDYYDLADRKIYI